MYINNKSMYSLLEATTKPENLIEFAVKNELPAIGICDFESTQSFYSFSNLAKKHGVKAILAVDTFVVHEENIEEVLLICCNQQSLYEINKALSKHEPAQYEQYHNTIVIFKNPLIKNINSKDYIGLTTKYLALNNIQLESNMLLIDSSYFYKKNDFEFFQIINAIRENTTVNKVHVRDKVNNYLKLMDNEYWFYDDLYSNYLNLITKLEQIEYSDTFKLPHFNTESDASNRDYLKRLMHQGLKKRLNGNIPSKYIERIEYEYKIIVELNFVDYFLIVWDIIKFARKQNIYVGPGRGSAAGSLLAYCLGITNIDPVKNDLLFERFLNPMRKTMPDIDIDFQDDRRDEIINYIIEKYGEDFVCQIGTLSTFQAKSAFREVAKAIDINKTTIDAISKKIDGKLSFKQNVMSNSKLSKEFATNGQLQYILDYIYKLEDMPKNKSIHASGIIISDIEIYHYTSLSEHISDLDSKTLEQIGLVKFDILAISNLRHISNIENLIKEKYHQLNFNTLDIADKEVYHAISDGYTNFIFQLESSGMISMLKKFRPNNFDDLAAILALYRPGPMQYIDEYIARKNGTKKIDYIDDSLKPILKSTFGIIVYQEQIMQIVKVFAGYNLGQADIFRRAISKKDKEILTSELKKFTIASIKNGHEESIVQEVANRIEAFANYGFNKSHAYSYAKISYALMYYKVNYPEIYFSYYLNLLMSTADMAKFEQEIKYFGLKLKRPSIKTLVMDSTLIDGYLQLGLNNINGLDREFKKELYEFIMNKNPSIDEIINECIIPQKISDAEVEKLVCSGLFDCFGYNEKTLITYILSKDTNQDVDALFFLETSKNIKKIENYNLLKLEELERKSLNLNIKYNSYDIYFKKLQVIYPNVKRIQDIDIYKLHNNFDVLIEVIKVKEIKTKTNKLMAFLDCKVDGKEASITIFPNAYQQFYDELIDLKGYALANVRVISNGFSLEKIKKL